MYESLFILVVVIVVLSILVNELENFIKHKIIVEENNNEAKTLGLLYFFKYNHTTYPELSKLANTFFTTPSTSVPSEALFSEAGIVRIVLRQQRKALELVSLNHGFFKLWNKSLQIAGTPDDRRLARVRLFGFWK